MKKYIVILLVAVILSSCGAVDETPTALPTVTTSPTVFSAQVTLTPTSLPTITPTLPPTATLVPPLPADEAKAKLLELLSNNGGCRLPCVLGITPGKNNIQEAISTLNAFRNIAPDDFFFDALGGGTALKLMQNDYTAKTSLIIEGDRKIGSSTVKRIEMLLSIYRVVDNLSGFPDNYVYDSQHYAQYFPYYALPYLFLNYGSPPNIYSAAYVGREIGGGDDVYLLRLDYKDSGWIAIFLMPLNQLGEFWEACPNNAIPFLIAGDIESADEQGFPYRSSGAKYLPLEEATSITLEDFYQQYSDPAITQCLEIPEDSIR